MATKLYLLVYAFLKVVSADVKVLFTTGSSLS